MTEERYSYELAEFGKHVRHFRKMKGLTQVDLEVVCKINSGDISRIENGQKNIEFITIVKLADALQVELFKLFDPQELVDNS